MGIISNIFLWASFNPVIYRFQKWKKGLKYNEVEEIKLL